MKAVHIPNSLVEKLRLLYFGNQKHSFYHPLPTYLEPYFPEVVVDYAWRHPLPRLNLLISQLSANDCSLVIEIGSNTGYQLLSLARQFPERKFIGFEISDSHVEFVKCCCEIEKLENVEIRHQEFVAQPEWLNERCVILDFNVAHHAGSDFMSLSGVTSESWWTHFLPIWLSSAQHVKEYWFSAGYRLGGKRELEVSDPNTPSEFVERVVNIVSAIDPTLSATVFVVDHEPNSNELRYCSAHELATPDIDNHLASLRSSGIFRGEYFQRPIFRFQ